MHLRGYEMSIPKNEIPKKDDAKSQASKKNEVILSPLKAKEPWPLKRKLIFWPVSTVVSFIIEALYLFLIFIACYSYFSAGEYLRRTPQVVAASIGLFFILYLLEYPIRNHNRHLSLVEFCASVYVVPAIVYGCLAAHFHSNADWVYNFSMDRFTEDDEAGYFIFEFMVKYIAIALLIRCFVAFLGFMSEYAKMKQSMTKKKKK